MKLVFWISFLGILYAYFGYPLILFVLGNIKKNPVKKRDISAEFCPSLSMIIPVYNEEKIIEEKIRNTISLDYPKGKLEVLIISDGSTDRTGSIVAGYLRPGLYFYELDERSGKAAALNLGLRQAKNEIVVFSDASIMLDKDALKHIVKGFNDENVGTISGEDYIHETGGEGLYGRYELFLRSLESRLHSIVGASGSFYAQRHALCDNFIEGMAPDFLSVLVTVEKGYRAITEPAAYGTMTSLKSVKDEFNRKVRTLIRGMAALFFKANLLNPVKFGFFSFELISHKLMRWLVPFFLIFLFLSNMNLLYSRFYIFAFVLQAIFYLLAAMSLLEYHGIYNKIWGKVPLYFSTVNVAILTAWYRYAKGSRQELWDSTKR